MARVQPLTIRGAAIWNRQDVTRCDLYMADRMLDAPASGALNVDLDGYTVFPGLINAHDHLELNHYPRSKFRQQYDNAHQWGEDMNARLDTEPYRSLRTYPLWDRLFIGGLKNLLCGATTVVHHNPPHQDLWRRNFPVRVLRNYGWAHSLHFSTDKEVVRSYRQTPLNWPWFIHLAEGTDAAAAGEYQRLKALGCVGPNTVIVHGVGLTSEDVTDAYVSALKGEYAGQGSQFPVVWCPTTNLYLLGKTGHARMGWNTGLFIGSDSRLTAEGDLLDEIRFAAKWYENQGGENLAIAGVTNTHLRRNRHCKDKLVPLCPENRADMVVIPASSSPAQSLCQSRRSDLVLVVRDSIPWIGDPDVMAKFPHLETVDAALDGVPKRIHLELAQHIHQCRLKEPGLEVDALPRGRRFWLAGKA
jgi:hypothetical protein